MERGEGGKAGLHPKSISYRMTGMDVQKKCSQKIKLQFLGLTILFVKRGLMKLFMLSLIITPSVVNYGKRIFGFTSSLNKTTKWFQMRIQKLVKNLRWLHLKC